MPWDLLIRGGQVVRREGVERLDLAIEAGRIIEAAPSLAGTTREEFDAGGLHVFPGVIDPHVHFNEPGRTDWEGFETGSTAFAAGGGTLFFDMPLNAFPPTNTAAAFDEKLAAARANSRTDFALWGGLTPDSLHHLDELAARGVIGFKAFMSDSGIEEFGRADDLTLYRGMKAAARLGLIVAVHAESQEITSRLTAEIRSRGGRSWRDYLDSRPVIAEVEAIGRAIILAEETGCRLHIVHVSSPRGVAAVSRAQAAGVDVTCETCPHYLTLAEEDLERLGAPAKCAPPVRTQPEIDALWQHVAGGAVAFVGSDHSPAPGSMKTGDDAFAIWGGIAGVQSTLGLMLSPERKLPLPLVAGLTSVNVAERFGLANKGQLLPGFDADLVLVDLCQSFTLTREMLHDKHKLSPYVGRSFTGMVKRTLVRGQTVFADAKPVGDFRGRLVVTERAPVELSG